MPIGIDHKDFLKKGTIDEIVYEKCSHLLGKSKIFISEQQNKVLNKIKKSISHNSSEKFIFGRNFNYKKLSKEFIYKDDLGEMNLPFPNLLGDFQISNVCTAIAVSRSLKKYKIYESHIKKAITKIRSEGRLQKITHGKLRKYVFKDNEILVDGAHNNLAASQISKYLKNLDNKKKIILMLGMMSNKDHKGFIQKFKNKIDSIVVLDIPNQINSIKKEKLLQIALSCGIPTKTENSIINAFKKISKENNSSIIFCTGSLYFAGEVLNLN